MISAVFVWLLIGFASSTGALFFSYFLEEQEITVPDLLYCVVGTILGPFALLFVIYAAIAKFDGKVVLKSRKKGR